MVRKIFYGWWIVVASFVVIVYGHIAREHRMIHQAIFSKLGPPDMGIVFSDVGVSFVFGLLGLLLAGPIVDKKGPKKPMLVGIALMGVSIILLDFVNSVWFVFPLMVLLGLGFGLSLSIAPHTAVANWFFNRRCLALAVLVVGPRLSFILAGEVGEFFSQYDWQLTLLGTTLLVIGIPLSLLIRHKPEPYGLLPYRDVSDESYQFTLRESLSSRAFWLLAVAVILSSIALANPAFVLMEFIQYQESINFKVFLVLPTVLGILLFGIIGDIYTKRYLLTATAASLGIGYVIGLIGLIAGGIWYLAGLYMVFYGVGSGLLPLMFAVRADYFGRQNFATISAVMIAITQLGNTGLGYSISFLGAIEPRQNFIIISAILGFIAAALFFFATSPQPSVSNQKEDSSET